MACLFNCVAQPGDDPITVANSELRVGASPSKNDRFRGKWYTSCGGVVTVADGVATADDGQVGQFTIDGDACEVFIDGQVCHGQFVEHAIVWEDGDVWQRTPPTSSGSSGTKGCKDEAGVQRGSTKQSPRSTLEELFPAMDRNALSAMLEKAKGDIDNVVQNLLKSTGTSGASSTSAGQQPPRAKLTRRGSLPVSPWSDAQVLQLRPGPDRSANPTMIRREEYDQNVGQRFRKGGCHQLAQVVKAASRWRGKAVEAVEAQGVEEDATNSFAFRPSLSKPIEIATMPTQAHVREGKALLDQRCAFLGLRQVEMEGDGNCQFRSLAQEIYGTQEHHKLVRDSVMAHMKSHSSDFSFLFEGGEWDRYVRKMSTPREWGDELTLRAACDAFNVKLHVLTSSGQNWYLVYDPASGECAREVFLTYIAPIHYNIMEPIS